MAATHIDADIYTKGGRFGHYTNDVVNFDKYFSYRPAVGRTAAETFGLFTPLREVVVLGQFFCLYAQDFDVQSGFIFVLDQSLRPPQRFEITSGNCHFHSASVGPGGKRAHAPLVIGFQMHLLNPAMAPCTTPDQKRFLRAAVSANMKKYFSNMLLMCFLNGTGLYRRKTTRIYFCRYSLQILEDTDYVTIPVNYQSVLSHFIKTDNNNIFVQWELLCAKLQKEFPSGHPYVTIGVTSRPHTESELHITGYPINPSVNDIEIQIKGTREQKQAGVVKLFQIFRCFNEEDWLQRNSLLEFFTYQFTNNAYIQDYKAFIQSTDSPPRPIPSNIRVHTHQNFIGQALRYISLSQTRYQLTIGADTNWVERPQFILIRDSHHACPTVFEDALMSAFKNSGKNYFWSTERRLKRRWHQTAVSVLIDGLPHVILNNPNDGAPAPTGPTELKRSFWAGLQSFYRDGDDDSVFGTRVFQDTLGIMYHHHELAGTANLLSVREAAYLTSGQPFPIFFSYGIDERILINCGYSVFQWLRDGRGQITRDVAGQIQYATSIRMSTDLEQRAAFEMQDGRANAIPALPSLSQINSNSIYKSFELSRKMKKLSSFFGNTVGSIGEPLPRLTTWTTGFTFPDVDWVRNISEVILYMKVRGRFPKTAYDLQQFVELARDKTDLLTYDMTIYSSLYIDICKLWRSDWQEHERYSQKVLYNDLWPIQSVRKLFEFYRDYERNTPIPAAVLTQAQQNTIHNIFSTANLNKEINPPVGLRLCRGGSTDYVQPPAAGARADNHCLSQPMDLPTTPRRDRHYIHRASYDTPREPLVVGNWHPARIQFGGNPKDGEKLTDVSSTLGTNVVPAELSDPTLSEPPLSEPPLSEPPLSEPPLSEPPLSEPPLSEPPLSEPPLSEPPLSEPPLSEPSEPSEPPEPPLSEPSEPSEPPEPPLSELPISEPPLSDSMPSKRVSSNQDIATFIQLIVYGKFYSLEEKQTNLSAAHRVLTDFNATTITNEDIQTHLNEIFTVHPAREDDYDTMYDDTSAVSFHRDVIDFLGYFTKYGKDFNNANPLLYLDIFLGLSKRPLVHFTTFLKEQDEIEEQIRNVNEGIKKQTVSKGKRKSTEKFTSRHSKRPTLQPTLQPTHAVSIGGSRQRNLFRKTKKQKRIR